MNANSDNASLRRPDQSTEPFTLSIDVAQWRHDVDAFTTATRQMLDSIHQELSSGLAQGHAQVVLVPQKQAPDTSSTQPTTRPLIDKEVATIRASNETAADEVAIESEQILARLKAQLAEQLNQ